MIYGDILLIVIELLMCVVCFFCAGFATKYISSKWKLLYTLPSIISIVFMGLVEFEISLLGLYFGSFLVLTGFFVEKRKIREVSSVIAFVLVLMAPFICNNYKGYRAPDYLAEFEKGFQCIKEHYALSEQKNIDWDALYIKYKPMFEEADKRHDEVENYIAWTKFTDEFYDGHVNYSTTKNVMDKAIEEMYGNDYGFSMVRISNPKECIVAVNVEEGCKAYEAGIRTGTEIVSIDNKTVEQVINEFDMPYYNFHSPVLENEEYIQPIIASGQGGDEIAITFIDENGSERSCKVEKIGSYSARLQETMKILLAGRIETNVTVTTLTEDTACLRLTQMIYDSKATETSDYSAFADELRKKLQEQKDAGVNNLIIDLRSNAGGDPAFILEIFKLLSPKGEHGYAFSGVWDYETNQFAVDEETGKYVVGEGTIFEGEDFLEGGQIVLLVNASCISAGDHLVSVMSEFDNVTVMGFTSTNCSGQAISGMGFEKGQLAFSAVPTLYEDGRIFIDTDESRLATTPLDVKLEMTKEAMIAIFDNGEDYEMNQAIQYIEKK